MRQTNPDGSLAKVVGLGVFATSDRLEAVGVEHDDFVFVERLRLNRCFDDDAVENDLDGVGFSL